MQETRRKTGAEPPQLVVVSDGGEPSVRLRGGDRQVRRWSRDDGEAGTFGGDPEQPATYEWLASARAVSLVVDVPEQGRALRIAEALRSVRPDAAVLVLSAEGPDEPGDGTLVRTGRLRDVLRLDVDEELERLEAERRVWQLRRFAGDADTLPILIHADPDPDALGSAYAVRALLCASADRMPIVTTGAITRPENRRMAELLDLRVTVVQREEVRGLERLIVVDTQPAGLGGDGVPRLAVIDHHAPDEDYQAEVLDVRPDYGATATMLTEYLRAAGGRGLGRATATALLHGIRTDTDGLRRGVTAADVAACAFLQEHADPHLLRRLERPALTPEAARTLGRGFERLRVRGELAVCHLGEIERDRAHLIADAADMCLDIEGALWAAGSALLGDVVIAALRHDGGDERGADALAAILTEDAGSGGGHATMARVELPREPFDGLDEEETRDALADRIAAAVERLNESSGAIPRA